MYDHEKEMWEMSRISRALGILEGMTIKEDCPAPVLKAAELLMEVVNGRIKTEAPG